MDPGEQSTTGVCLPPNARLERDVPYGDDPQQRLDVYIPRPGQGGSGHLDGAWGCMDDR